MPRSETEKAELIARIIHDEIVVHQTPGFTPFWENQPVSYHLEAMRAPIVLKILAAVKDDGYNL